VTQRLLRAPFFSRPVPSACLSLSTTTTGRAPAGQSPPPPHRTRSSFFVSPTPRPAFRAFSIRRGMYEDAGADMTEFVDGGIQLGGQLHKGGARNKGGRPVGSRRYTRETLSTGCGKAIAIGLSQYGVEWF